MNRRLAIGRDASVGVSRYCEASDFQQRHAMSSVSRHSWKFRPLSVGRGDKIATPATPLDNDEISDFTSCDPRLV